MKKKGVSTTIETLLIIMLTFAALGIIAGFVVPYVKDGLNKGTECFDYKEYFTFEEELGYNCQNSSDGKYWISVRAKNTDEETREDIKGFLLSFKVGGERESFEISSGVVNGVSMLNGNSNLTLPRGGEVKTYVYNPPNNYSAVEIYVSLKSGRVCEEKSDEISLEDKC